MHAGAPPARAGGPQPVGAWPLALRDPIHAHLSLPCGEPDCILGEGLGSVLTITPLAARWVLGHGVADRPGAPVRPSRERWQWVGSVGFSCFPCLNRKKRKVVSGPGDPSENRLWGRGVAAGLWESALSEWVRVAVVGQAWRVSCFPCWGGGSLGTCPKGVFNSLFAPPGRGTRRRPGRSSSVAPSVLGA